MYYPNNSKEPYTHNGALSEFLPVVSVRQGGELMIIKDFNEILSLGNDLLYLRVYIPYEPCDRIGYIYKVTNNSILYNYLEVHRHYQEFILSSGRIDCNNFQNAIIENLHDILVERNLQEIEFVV